MVEGPGCKLKGLKLKKIVKGQTVKAVSGAIIEQRTKANRDIPSNFEQLIGLVLLDVKTLGKELFALFENDICLRVHFLMSGSARYNNEPKEFGDGNAAEPRLKLHMSKDEVAFFDTAVELRSCAECIEKHNMLIDLDICSPTFNAKRASLTIREHPERLVCDVILDQLVLPGVGNIIKNEALFDAGINPTSKVKDLNEELVSHLVKMNRDFTNIFYKCRKEGKDLRKNMRVYKKEKCPECGSKITKCKIGEYQRLTFFCRLCQTNTIKTGQKLATRNSLLGWVQTIKTQVPWNCSVCTLENKPANTKCAACLMPKNTSATAGIDRSSTSVQVTSNAVAKWPSQAAMPVGSTGARSCMSASSSSASLTSSTSSPSTEGSETMCEARKRPLESTPGENCKIGKYTFKRMSSGSAGNTSPASTQQNGYASPLPRPKTQSSSSPLFSPTSSLLFNPRVTGLGGMQQPKKIFTDSQPAGAASKMAEEQVLCSGHKKRAKKTVVEKKNENRGRVFYVCNMPPMKQCKFFMWGDAHHPFCGHGKISVVRSVMKMNANNGREFYCCSMPKGKQCDFFEWVDKKT